MSESLTKTQIKKLENAEIEIVGEMPAVLFAAYRPRALANLQRETKLDGFRPGHAPEPILLAKIGEERLLVEMAELALREVYPKIIAENHLAVIGRPEITLTKLVRDNPLGFKIKTAVNPELILPDYSALARKQNAVPLTPVTVEEKEVAAVIEEAKKIQQKMPAINEELKQKIRENLQLEKERKQQSKRRLQIMEAILTETKLILPAILIESELERMLAELKTDIESSGLKYEDYLAHLKKTETELRAAWRADAEKRVKTSLLLAEIAEVEKLAPSAEEIEVEAKHLQEHYKNAPAERVRAYVITALTSEKVWRWLESQK